MVSVSRISRALLAITLAIGIAACSRNDSASFVASAKSYMAKSDYKAAIVQLKNAVAGAPNDPETRFLLAKAMLEAGDVVGAETEVRKAIDLKYSPEETYPLLARALLAEGKYDAAIAAVGTQKLETAQARADVGTTVAVARSALGDVKEARSAIDAVLKEAPGNSRALVVKAQIVAQAGDLSEAMKLVDTALAGAPTDKDALLLKAQLLSSSGQRDEAVALLEKTTEAHPEDRNARLSLISLLVASQRIDDAARQLDKLKAAAPNEIGTTYADALVTTARGDAAQARTLIQKVLAARPEHLPSLYLSGFVDSQLKSYASAEETLRKLVAMVPNDIAARKLLASVYIQTGQPKLALETIDPALRRSPDDPALLRTAAEAMLGAGNVAKGAELYERANSIDKNNIVSNVRLAQVRLATGETERAMKDLESLSKTDKSQSQADLALIMAHVQRREFDKALAAVDALEKKQPNTPLTQNLRGGIYMGKRDFKAARKSFEKAHEMQPTDLSSAANLALLDVQEGKADDARKRYEQMLQKDPKNEQILLSLADLTAMTRANQEEAKAIIDKAIAANPQSVRPRLALVGYYSRMGDVRAALNAAQAAQSLFPNDPQVIDAVGATELASGAANQGLATYARLAEMQPQNAAVQLRVAALRLQAKDSAGAAEAARKVIAAVPESPQAWAILARAQMQAGHTDEALAEARKLQKEHPDHAFGYALEGEIRSLDKKWSEAAAVLRTALSKQQVPLLAVSYYSALQNAGKAAEATSFAEKWIREHPTDTTMLQALGEQSLAKKEYASSAARYRAILEIAPDNAVALNNLAWLLGEAGDPKAREYAERAYQLAPFQPNVIDTLGWTLVRTGDLARGTQLLQLASNLAPRENEIRLHLGRALIKSGDKEGGRRVLEPLTKLDSASTTRADAEKALAGN
ncbi:MAG TPA: XrtA/PEP-CTERM system TPR-repeat protein PrsT [Casimicrobiaceae bacterium]|jgi:putative PEP-CTERM system TPR-repeat lipoprotein